MSLEPEMIVGFEQERNNLMTVLQRGNKQEKERAKIRIPVIDESVKQLKRIMSQPHEPIIGRWPDEG